mgnify:CR=1 FL=1
MKHWGVFFLLMLFCSCRTVPRPVNPEASEEAASLLEFLYSISGKYILSGGHNFVSSGSRYHEKIKEITGKYPVVWGSDFSFCVTGENARHYHHCGPMNLTDYADSFAYIHLSADTLRMRMVREAIRQWEKGHIITLMWHCCFPPDGDTCMGSSIWAMENRPNQAVWDSLTTDGTALNRAWKKQVDGIAYYLKILRDAHVPVLWRPYHEMNGVWFWWCNHRGDEGFRKLWKMMYHYLTCEHHLNNLLWVWDANAPRNKPGDEAYAYEWFYPGNDYVDVLAADIYGNDYRASHYDQLLALGGGKPIAMGEVGELPSDSILTAQPRWSWFMTWGYFICSKHNPPEKVIQLYSSPQVLTADEVYRDKQGGWHVR